ncbi:MAG TPA: exodeoxyribonuclease VII large subunit [Vicinamibacterales bacterium]|jgi:exodeoxyribonuclease VII large subunit|nr:exodeoxyribonuclease VII large subunit [Vicinamibacterales bacterium]
MSDLFSQPFEEEEERPPAGLERRVLSVSELTASIRAVIESSFGDVWVEGEISNCRIWHTGHAYFTLKDSGAQIKAVLFRGASRYLKFNLEDGLHVIARGKLGIYEPKGEYQLVCEHLQPKGLGSLQLAFEQLKKKLKAEGLFDPARKRALPALPRIIGIVTSLDGAALRDIIKVLRRRHPNAHLLIRPARVQGEAAADDLAKSLRAIGRVAGVDVVILTRGGGSVEDLWSFNEEVVARAIAACPVPVISAVGHEVDVTIADFVADVRAPTPSAAAEFVIAAKEEFCARIDRLTHRLTAAAAAIVQRRRTHVHALSSRRGLAGWPARVALNGRHAAELTFQLRRSIAEAIRRRDRMWRTLNQRLEAHDLRRRLATIHGRLNAADSRLQAAVLRRRERAQASAAALAGRLETLSPLGVLARGYALCWNEDRTAVLRRAASIAPGDRVRVTLHEGELACEVREVVEDDDR